MRQMSGAVLYIGSQNCHLCLDGQTIAVPSILYVKRGTDVAGLWQDCRRSVQQADFYNTTESEAQAELLTFSSLFRPNFTAPACFKGFIALFLRSKPIEFSTASLLSGVIDTAAGDVCDVSALLAVFLMQIRYSFDIDDLQVVLPDIPLQNIGLLQQLTKCVILQYQAHRKYLDFDVEVERRASKASQFSLLKQQVFKSKQLCALAECGGRPLECYFNSYFPEILANALSRKSLASALGCSLDFVATVMGAGEVYSLGELATIKESYASIVQKHAAATTCGEAFRFSAAFAGVSTLPFNAFSLPDLQEVVWVQGRALKLGGVALETRRQEYSAYLSRFGVYLSGFIATSNGQTVLLGADKSTIVWCY